MFTWIKTNCGFKKRTQILLWTKINQWDHIKINQFRGHNSWNFGATFHKNTELRQNPLLTLEFKLIDTKCATAFICMFDNNDGTQI